MHERSEEAEPAQTHVPSDAEWAAFEGKLARTNRGQGEPIGAARKLPEGSQPTSRAASRVVSTLHSERHEEYPTVTVRLNVPVTIGGERIAVVEFRQPSLGDVERVMLGEVRRGDLIASMAGQPAGFLGALCVADADIVVRIANVILPETRIA